MTVRALFKSLTCATPSQARKTVASFAITTRHRTLEDKGDPRSRVALSLTRQDTVLEIVIAPSHHRDYIACEEGNREANVI